MILRPEAETDIGDAATWYEEQKAGLGGEFVEAVFHAIDALSVNPLLTSRRHRLRNSRWIFLTGSPSASSTRCRLIRYWLFPFSTQPGMTGIGARD